MYRRVVSLVMIPCFLLSQAAVGHCHDDGRPAGHDVRAHLHASLSPSHHGHHGHDDHHGHHHHPAAVAEPTHPSPTSIDCCPAPGHDEDAYAIDVGAVTLCRTQTADRDADGVVWFALPPGVAAACPTGPGGPSVCRPNPPRPPGAFECPLYVRHLTILV